MAGQTRILNTTTLALIAVAAIISLRNLPMAAEYGLGSIFFYLLAALLFFIPISLVTAELATGWSRAGGNYTWVSEAFGKDVGFVAIWLSWLETITWFPAILAFTAVMLANVLDPVFPGLEHNKIFTFVVVLVVFWSSTILNFFGIKTSGLLSSIGVLAGTLIPGLLIIILGVWWWYSGNSLEMDLSFTVDNLIPDLHFDNIVFFSGILFGLAGIEIVAYHVNDAKNPQKQYPKALLMAVVIILAVSILGTLAIAAVVPSAEVDLLSGLIQAYRVFFDSFGMSGIIPFLALLLLIGSLAGVNTWTIGPAKGLLVTACDGYLPPVLQKTNKNDAPVGMLVLQAIIGSILSIVFLFMETTSTSYWILTALSILFTMTQYSLVYAAALKLRYSQPNTARSYNVPGGKPGMWLIAIIGILTCMFGFGIVFVPPVQLPTGDAAIYKWLLMGTFVVLASPPLILAKMRKPQWISYTN